MKYGVYCIRDFKSGWLSPTVDINDQVAIRNFAYAVQHNELFSDFASDYSLFKIGDFDTDSGDIVNLPHVFLADAASPSRKSYSVIDDAEVNHE